MKQKLARPTKFGALTARERTISCGGKPRWVGSSKPVASRCTVTRRAARAPMHRRTCAVCGQEEVAHGADGWPTASHSKKLRHKEAVATITEQVMVKLKARAAEIAELS